MEESEAINSVQALVPFLLITFIIVIGVILLNHRFRKNLYTQQLAQEKERLEYQQNILQTTIQVQEDERERFAKDLHDEMGAMLSIAKRWLHQLEAQKPENEEKIAEVRQLVETMLESARRISHDLMPLQLESAGFTQTLLSLAKRAEKTGNVKVTVELSAELDKLDGLMHLSLYRICAELINNSLKYASADHLHLALCIENGLLHCNYHDNGVGIETKAFHEGLGLRSIESRVQSMNGSFQYGNRVTHQGFFASIRVPL